MTTTPDNEAYRELPGFRQFADIMAVAGEINGYAAGGGRSVVPAKTLRDWSRRIQKNTEAMLRAVQ